jgi:hypothetical protein
VLAAPAALTRGQYGVMGMVRLPNQRCLNRHTATDGSGLKPENKMYYCIQKKKKLMMYRMKRERRRRRSM